MTVEIGFQLDTKDGMKAVRVSWPHDSVVEASDKLDRMLSDCDGMLRVRDADTGNYLFVNSMKLANVVIEESDQ